VADEAALDGCALGERTVADDALFTIAGQEFKVTSPDRVLYPATGTT
jgi:hypothetical protein